MPDDDGWRPFAGEWGLVLGASSGFGAATARELGRRGMGIIGVHLDRKVTLPLAEAVAADVHAAGSLAEFFNVNAADDEKRAHVCDRARELTGGKPLRVLLHSLAFGTLKPFVSDVPDQPTTKAQLEMTLDVMAHSLVYWVQDLHARGLLGEGSRVFAMTSSGGAPGWRPSRPGACGRRRVPRARRRARSGRRSRPPCARGRPTARSGRIRGRRCGSTAAPSCTCAPASSSRGGPGGCRRSRRSAPPSCPSRGTRTSARGGAGGGRSGRGSRSPAGSRAPGAPGRSS